MRAYSTSIHKRAAFTIVEVLVAAGLLGALAMGFVSYLNSALKGQKNVQNAVDFDVLKSSISLLLSSKACDGSFQSAGSTPMEITFPAGVAPGTAVISASAPVPIEKIVMGSSVIVSQKQNLGGGMTVNKLEFVEAIYDKTETISSIPYLVFSALLKIEAGKQSGSLGAQNLSKTFGVRLLVSSLTTTTGRIDKCGPGGAGAGGSGTSSSGFGGFAVFASPGTYSFTVPTGVSQLKAEVWGGGGGGGAGATGARGGGGGGSAFAGGVFAVSAGSTYPLVVGAGGTGHSSCSPSLVAKAGESSSFATFAVAAGGGPGAPHGRWGGGGGVASAGQEKIDGENGGEGSDTGYGGASPKGGYGGVLIHSLAPAPPLVAPTNAGVPSAPGGGGAGGGAISSCSPGFAGAPGRVVLSW